MSSHHNETNNDAEAKRTADDTECLQYDDSDKEPADMKLDGRLWRLAPEESRSDWTIEVSCSDDKEFPNQTFHVHKCVLVAGKRHSEYFLRLFQQQEGSFSELTKQKSTLCFEKIVIEAFPIFLDYLYSPQEKLQVTTETATALHHLGSYFEMRHLRYEAKQFWKQDLNAETCGIYYAHASMLHDDKIKDAVVQVCASKFTEITQDSEIVRASDPNLWLKFLPRCQDVNLRERSEHLSLLVAAFCVGCEDLDSDTLLALVKEEHFPSLHPDAAFKFIALENEIVAASPSDSETGLSDLQRCCIDAIVLHWKTVGIDEEKLDCLNRQSPLLLAQLFAKSIKRAQVIYSLEHFYGESSRKRHLDETNSVGAKLCKLDQDLDTVFSSVEQSEHQQFSQIQSLQEQVRTMRHELDRRCRCCNCRR